MSAQSSRSKNDVSDVTMLQSRSRVVRGGNNAKPITTRKVFLEAFEQGFGNVTAACHAAGISRQTFYRWMKSKTRVNRKFQEKVSLIRPEDRLVDMLENAFVRRIQEGSSDSLIQFGLRSKGRNRGWNDRPVPRTPEDRSRVEKVAVAFESWKEDFPKADLDEIRKWFFRFASQGGVDPSELAAKVGLSRASLGLDAPRYD